MMLHMRIYNWLYAMFFAMLFKRYFGRFGDGVRIISPMAIEGPGNIYLGNGVLVAAQTCLAAIPLTGDSSCRLELGDGCRIGRFNHIYATGRIVIGRDVLTANNVYIADNLHDYRNPNAPILRQPIIQKSFVSIGDGSWLGHNVCVMGVQIGRNCVIGANSVVTRDLPDFSVAVGSPAIVIKRFNSNTGSWMKTSPDGEFI